MEPWKLNLNPRRLGLLAIYVGLLVLMLIFPRIDFFDFLFFVLSISAFLWYIKPIKEFFKRYGSYFSISIIYILLIGGILTTVDQIDNMVVDLFDFYDAGSDSFAWSNLLLFILIQFPFSLVLVWYLPNYLRYTDAHFKSASNVLEKRSFLELLAYRFNFSVFGSNAGNKLENNPSEQKFRVAFHNTRRLLGEAYIITFFYFLFNILNRAGWEKFEPYQAFLLLLFILVQYKMLKWIHFYKFSLTFKDGLLIESRKVNLNIGARRVFQIILPFLHAISFVIFGVMLFNGNDYLFWANGSIFIVFLACFYGFAQKSNEPILATREISAPNSAKSTRMLLEDTRGGMFIFAIFSLLLVFLLATSLGQSAKFWPVLLCYAIGLVGGYLYSRKTPSNEDVSSGKPGDKVDKTLRASWVMRLSALGLMFVVFSIVLCIIFPYSIIWPIILTPGVFIFFNLFFKVIQLLNRSPKKPKADKENISLQVHAFLGFCSFVLFPGLVIFTAFDFLSILEGPWNLMPFYLLVLVLLLNAFVFLCDYRKLMRRYSLEKWSFIHSFVRGIERFFVPLVLLSNFFFVLFYVGAWSLSLFKFETLLAMKINLLNPINIFFLAINGLFPLMAVAERFLLILDTRINILKRIPLTSSKIGFALIAILFVLGFSNLKQGNGYHSIDYTIPADTITSEKIPVEKVPSPYSLEQYTQGFLKRLDQLNSDTIYLVAADGGGLKAAYWTMLVLEELDKKINLSDHLFMSSGASGGSVGLGMYTYLKALNQYGDPAHNSAVIEAIGGRNFLNMDLIGLLGRWPYKMLGKNTVAGRKDRMDIMAEDYFKTSHKSYFKHFSGPTDSELTYAFLTANPFSYLWTKHDYKIPLFVVNTARMEDGRMGIIHPLKTNLSLTSGMIDLSYVGLDSNKKLINYPDALFNTNRFPVISPYAEIEGKGHFFDAGAVENSGIGTILSFLQYMKGDSAYTEFFASKEIILISIRSAKSRYIYEHFSEYEKDLKQTRHMFYLEAIAKGISSGGQTGKPMYYDQFMNDPIRRNSYGIHSYKCISMPAEIDTLNIKDTISMDDIENTLYGKVTDPSIRAEINGIIATLNHARKDTYARYLMDQKESQKNPESMILQPPLGRMLAKEARDYMKAMSAWKTAELIKELKQPEKGH